MIKVGQKYNVRLESLLLTPAILREKPIWYHTFCKSKHPQTLYNRGHSACIQNNHRVMTVGDTEILARKLEANRHQKRAACRCNECQKTRQETHCNNPNACYQKAKDLLNALPHKWNLLMKHPMPEMRTQNAEYSDGDSDNKSEAEFDPQMS